MENLIILYATGIIVAGVFYFGWRTPRAAVNGLRSYKIWKGRNNELAYNRNNHTGGCGRFP